MGDMETRGKRFRRAHQPQQQQQQQQPCEEQQQQHDWEAVLKLAVVRHGMTHGSCGTMVRALHRVNHSMREAARGTMRHLSLLEYHLGCLDAQRVVARLGGSLTPAMAAAAAAPAIPWDLLAATPSLTSLELWASQVQQLLAGSAPTTTAMPAAAPTAAAAAPAAAVLPAASAQAGGSDVLAATLGRLRCLQVMGVEDDAELVQLGRLLARTTQLTQLELTCEDEQEFSCEGLLEQLGCTAQGMPAVGAAAGWLPQLCHLVVNGHCSGLLPAWLNDPAAALWLTCLHLTQGAARADAGVRLSACSGLRELVFEGFAPYYHTQVLGDFTTLTGLTRLGLRYWTWEEVPPVLWDLTTLRCLELGNSRDALDIPEAISNLQQLRVLSVAGTAVEALPADLGTWLPQLEELDVACTPLHTLPAGLTRVTLLRAWGSAITEVSAIQHLVALKQLGVVQLKCGGSRPASCLQPLSRLSALEALTLFWEEEAPQQGGQVAVLPLMPGLRSVQLSGPARVWQLQSWAGVQLQQLTHLAIQCHLTSEDVAALGQLGVLPRLEQLVLGKGDQVECWDGSAVARWMQQQPRLTSLTLAGCRIPGALLRQLPAQLEELRMHESRLFGRQPAALTQLSRLLRLSLTCQRHKRLPPWLSSLRRLQGLGHVQNANEASGWEVLAQLPALRGVGVGGDTWAHVRGSAPHMCWW